MVWPMDRVQQMVIAKLSLRLSLNNPSNIWHCSNEICHKTAQRERERKKRGEKERERASWMPNDMVTAGNRVPQVEFPSSVLSILWMCSLMDCCVWSQVIAFGGVPIVLQCFVHISDRKNIAILILTATHIWIVPKSFKKNSILTAC